MRSMIRHVAAAALCALALSATAQEKKPGTTPPPGMPPMPKPGPEHAVLKDSVGVWDATVESWMEPGKPATTSKGVETNTMVGDFWVVTDFKSEMMGSPFQGRGAIGYDPAKKKYVSTWIDSMTPSLSVGESDYNKATKTMTGWTDGLDYAGKPTKIKAVTVWKGPATRVFTMSLKGPDGKDMTAMRITYKKRK